MTTEPAILAEDLGIQFYKSRRRRASIRNRLFRRDQVRPTEQFWGLRHISFSVPPGQAVGLVGANGQGKSTLLKLVAGVLIPDEGHVVVHGGVAPLIEVTGGFVGDLTVRDNIVLTAGLHGLSRAAIDERFDDIVAFAAIGDRLDMPYRHLSSGMKARLGFSVVTQLDEPVVLVDEVLAVGDPKFKRKCYRRMEEMLGDGRTLFLVSHNENDLRRFCTRGLYLRQGELMEDGDLDTVLAAYALDLDA